MPQLDDRQSVRDLDGVRVAVEGPVYGTLTADAVRARVEARLRAAAIPILGAGEFPTGDPHLRVTFTPSVDGAGATAVFVQVDFAQIVFLRRSPQLTFNRAQTWKASANVLLGRPAGMPALIIGELDRQVDQFIAAYHRVTDDRRGRRTGP